MESDTTATVPESFSKTHDAFMINNLHVLENLFITFRHAALWEEENPSVERPSWWENLDDVVRNQADSLGMTARKLADASGIVATQSSRTEVAAACESFLNEVSKLFDLLAMFEVVGEDEDDGGHREEVHWSRCFEILLDSLKRIEEGSDKLWDILVENPKRTNIEQGKDTADERKEAVHYPTGRGLSKTLCDANDELGRRIANIKDHIATFTIGNLWNEDPSDARSHYSKSFEHMREQALALVEGVARFKSVVPSDLPHAAWQEFSRELAAFEAEVLRLQKLVHLLVAEASSQAKENTGAAESWPVRPEDLRVVLNSVSDKRLEIWLRVVRIIEMGRQKTE